MLCGIQLFDVLQKRNGCVIQFIRTELAEIHAKYLFETFHIQKIHVLVLVNDLV